MFSENEILTQITQELDLILYPLEIINKDTQLKLKNNIKVDLVVNTKYKKWKYILLIEVKSIGEPRHIERAILQLKNYSKDIENSYPVIATSYISEKSRNICKDFDVGYIDLSGNIFIDLPHIYIDKESKKGKVIEKKILKSLFTPVSSRIIRSILIEPDKTWTLNNLSKYSKVSIGHAHKVVNKLINGKYVIRNKNNNLELVDPERLLNEWREIYSFKNNKINSFYSFHKDNKSFFNELIKFPEIHKLEYALTLHSGAYFIAPHVRFNDIHFYIKSSLDKWIKYLDLRPVEMGANVYLLEPYDEGVFNGTQMKYSSIIVSDIQLYLDLYNYPSRGREQADFLREKQIKF